MKNKIISVILIILISIALPPFPERGEAASYNLVVNPVDNSVAGRIVVGEGEIYVYSHINTAQTDYFISSKELVSSLSCDGYSISYVDNDKNAATVSRVEDGYIKLTSSSETIYLPIKTNSDIIWSEDFTDFSSEGYYTIFGDGCLASKNFVKNYNGKTNDDISLSIRGNGDTNIYPCGEGYSAYVQRNNVATINSVATLDFNFCNSSDGCMFFNLKLNSLKDILKVDAKGNVFANSTYKGNIAPDEWHRASITFDYIRNRILIFVDGIFLDEPYLSCSGIMLNHFKLALRGDSDEDGNSIPVYGAVVYDDVKIYGGYPLDYYDTMPGIMSDTLIVDNNNRIIYGATGKNSSDVLSALTPELGGVVQIEDSIITNSTVANLSFANGNFGQKSTQYCFSDETYVSPVTLLNTGVGTIDDVSVKLSAIAGTNSSTNTFAILATYKNTELTSVQLLEADISTKQEFEFNVCIDREDSQKIKVFWWDGKLSPLYGSDLTQVSKKETVFSSETQYINLMSDYIGLHLRSGLLTAYNEKTILQNKPYEKDSVYYVSPKEIADVLGIDCSIDGNTVTIDSNSVVANPENSLDGKIYITTNEMFETLLGLETQLFTYEFNGGAIIAGEEKFSLPDDVSEKELNSYLYNLRPSQADIKQMYASSPLKGEHPRIYIDSDDLTRIKSEIETNEIKKRWADTIVSAANWDITRPIVEYEIDGGRLLGVSRKVLQYMHSLGMAYLLTGEQKYVDRAFLHLEAAANFPDWHPDHSLDTGEMCAAFAVGYDWMYDAFTPDQRKVIEEGFLKNGIRAANNLYEGEDGRTGSVYAESNWASVVNGGIATGAMAFMDVYPENCSQILANSVRGFEHLIWRFAPDGGWYEGPGYWEYTIKYASKMLSNTTRILGTDFSFTNCEGFNKTVDYALAIQSSNGTFCYGDCMSGTYLIPEMYWVSNILSKPEYTSTLLTLSNGSAKDYEDLALSLCWYDVSIDAGNVHLPLDNYIRKEEVVSMRSGWSNDDSFFAAAAGTNGGGHDHLDSGSFVFDTGGVRWSIDLGQANYNNERYSYWDYGEDGDRWKIYRLRAEAHSTIVINPDSNIDQALGSFADVVRLDSGEDQSILEIDMSDTLSKNASSAKRAFALTNDKQSLVIRDEITVSDSSKSNEIYWIMMTSADVITNDTGAVLTKDGETLYLNFASDVDAEISCDVAQSFDETGVIDDETDNETAKRILIKMTTSDKANITVSLSQTEGTSLLDSYNKSISNWNVN